MASTLHGNDGLVLSSAGEITATKAGLWTGSCLYSLPADRIDLIPNVGAVHPYASFLVAESFRLVFAPGLWKLYVEYAGANRDVSEPTYDLSPGTGNDPIETHSRFLSHLAGKPSAPKNGAIFRNPETGEVTKEDEPGAYQFDRFSVLLAGGNLNPYAGLESYICQNNTVWTKSWTQRSAPTSHPVRIGAPDGPAPNYGGDTNWLELPVAYTKRGNVFSCVAQWLASGPRGWNPVVYPSS